MSVGENIEYGLLVRGIQENERRHAVRELLELVRLPHTYDRRVHQLSGGERQRIALARALAPRPTILLLDEPLGALDEKLRVEMQVELQDLQRRLGTTFIYVTHSQEEALTMSDNIILMAKGRVVQEGPPHAMFDRPNSRFAATFMGTENVLDGQIERVDDETVTLRLSNEMIRGYWYGCEKPHVGQLASMSVRAERVRLAQPRDGASITVFPCTAQRTVYKGKYFDRVVHCPIGQIVARVWDGDEEVHEPAQIWWRDKDCAIVPRE